jgi:hypothetical protein
MMHQQSTSHPSVELPYNTQTIITRTVTMSNNNSTDFNTDANQSAPSSNEMAPYTLTEQDDRIHVAFTAGPMQGESFQIDRSQLGSPEQWMQPKQAREEPSHPFSYLDDNGNEISEEEYDRLSAIEIAEEASMEREREAAQAGRGT